MRQPMAPASTCIGCSGPLQSWLSEVVDPQSGEVFDVLRWRDCSLGHTDPVPVELVRYYGPNYYGNRHGVTARWCAHRRMQWVSSWAGTGSGRRLLDIGCGDGSFLQAAAKVGWQGVGTELNPEAARRNGLDIRPDLHHTTPDSFYDCITSWHSLEHMPDPRAVIAIAAQKLARDGQLIMAVPDADGLQARIFGRHWFHLDVPRHLYHFNLLALKTLLEREGFTIVATHHQEFEYDLLGWSQSALNALMPQPNIFFAHLTGHPVSVSRSWLCLNGVLGVIFSCLALPLVFLGTVLRRNGTLVIVARRQHLAEHNSERA